MSAGVIQWLRAQLSIARLPDCSGETKAVYFPSVLRDIKRSDIMKLIGDPILECVIHVSFKSRFCFVC